MRPLVTLLLVLSALAAPAASAAQETPAGPPAGGRGGARPGGVPGGGQAQASGVIRGTIVDAAGQAIRSASVAVLSARDASLVTGGLTDGDGGFRLEGLRPGRYNLRISAIGHQPITRSGITVTPAAPQADAGRIALAAASVALEGLTVTSTRREATLAPDRNTYMVRDMPAASGGSAIDVLRNVPAVEVDGDNAVSLRGSQNVVVQINGRPAPLRGEQLGAFLAQLPSNIVERIEVVPNPSARYDPEGMAGIVNIQLKQNTDLGLSGGATLGTGTRGQFNGSGHLGYQAGALTLFGSYGFMFDNRETDGFNNTRYLDAPTIARTGVALSEQDLLGEMTPASHSLTGTAEYRLSASDALSINTVLSKRGAERSNRNFLREFGPSEELAASSQNLTTGDSDDLSMDYALTFKHTPRSRTNEFSAELRYNLEREDQFNLFRRVGERASPLGRLQPRVESNTTDESHDDVTLQADWMRVFGEATKLEMGYKGVLRQMDNDFVVREDPLDTGEWVNSGRSNAFDYDERVNAAYAVVSRSVGQFSLQGGLRAERARTRFDLATTGESFDNGYNSLFPSALAAFNPDDSRQLKVSYSKRVERPRTRQLNPFGFSNDPLNIFRGNPSLQPEYTHAFELGYQQSLSRGSLQVTPFYRRTVDAVRRLRTIDSVGVSTTTFANVATSQSYGTDLTGSLRLGRVTGFGGLSAYQQVTDASNLNTSYSNNAFGWSARGNATVKLMPKLDLQGMVSYRAPMRNEQGRSSGMTMTNFALRQRLLGDRASLTLRVMDPFDTMGFGSRTDDPFYLQEARRSFGARGAFLSFNYSFGQQPRVRQQRGGEPEEPRGEDMGGI